MVTFTKNKDTPLKDWDINYYAITYTIFLMDTLSVTYVIWLFGLGEKKDHVKRRKDKELKEQS